MNPRKLVELPAGHASLASQPSAVTDLIVDALSDIQVWTTRSLIPRAAGPGPLGGIGPNRYATRRAENC